MTTCMCCCADLPQNWLHSFIHSWNESWLQLSYVLCWIAIAHSRFVPCFIWPVTGKLAPSGKQRIPNIFPVSSTFIFSLFFSLFPWLCMYIPCSCMCRIFQFNCLSFLSLFYPQFTHSWFIRTRTVDVHRSTCTNRQTICFKVVVVVPFDSIRYNLIRAFIHSFIHSFIRLFEVWISKILLVKHFHRFNDRFHLLAI